MKASDVEGAREHILVALQKYEVLAVLTAGLSVMGYLAREIMHMGIASSKLIVVMFSTALTAAFEPVSLDGLPKKSELRGIQH